MSTFYGVIRPGTPTGRPAGWYYCEPSACAPQVGSASFQVSGISIKSDTLSAGDEVDIISVGDWSQYSMEFGFIKRSARHGSVYGAPDSARAQLIATEPASCALAWLASKAGKTRTWYRVATVSNLLITELRVVDRVTGEPGVLPVSSDLKVSDFKVGELVLVETVTTARVIGWWQPRQVDPPPPVIPYHYWRSTTSITPPEQYAYYPLSWSITTATYALSIHGLEYAHIRGRWWDGNAWATVANVPSGGNQKTGTAGGVDTAGDQAMDKYLFALKNVGDYLKAEYFPITCTFTYGSIPYPDGLPGYTITATLSSSDGIFADDPL